jgi:hypothetical protein
LLSSRLPKNAGKTIGGIKLTPLCFS